MDNLLAKKCIPCSIGDEPLKENEIIEYSNSLDKEWKVVELQRLEKNYRFKNFREALDFTVQVGELAETEGHHPDIYLSWGKVVLKLWTHKIGGLHENDFILAAKIDGIKK